MTDSITTSLGKNPIVGMTSSILAGTMSFMDVMQNAFGFASVLLGFGVGVLTFMIKLKEYKAKAE
jgi:hypothetical protein